ncbi:MAG TPA: ABC transporter permease subunit [Caulobacteraceae bacterium]|jgi:NitT/TauT family transport system permease protein|nr:ABC transporter permease subunit [Caulobacteraceae bacterium]
MRRLINLKPSPGARILLGVLPLLALALIYLAAASIRHAENPSEKILPTLGAMVDQARIMAFQVDPRTGAIPLWQDTAASLERLGLGLAIAAATTLVLGLLIGVLPLARASLGPLVAAIAVIPPIAVLPILFITFGLGETAKIVLIVVGVTPFMVRDLAGHVAAIPEEQIVKAQTLGASTWQIALRVALPQAMPRLLESLRLSLGPAWVFLISAEAIASDVGLGYRIFLVRRYLAMDIILPYVAWTALLAVAFDLALLTLSRRVYPWAHPARAR